MIMAEANAIISLTTASIPSLLHPRLRHFTNCSYMEGERDVILHKAVWHLSDDTLKNIYTLYIMIICWGCCFFGSAKDPYYDSEQYRKDGGDGTDYWTYEKQEDVEEAARAQLWREELIEEIEQKVGLRELEEAVKKKQEEIVKRINFIDKN